MNINPEAKTVLCFGDSNTWGQTPHKKFRYPANERWTGVLQAELGDDFYVIEEGLGGRVTDFDANRVDRNGMTYLLQASQAHNPVDYFVLMLGTNDMKYRFNRSTEDIVSSLGKLLDVVDERCRAKDGSRSKVILISPIKINTEAPTFAKMYAGDFDASSAEKADSIGSKIERLAMQRNCLFLDASLHANSGEDGLHLDEASNQSLARAIKEIIV